MLPSRRLREGEKWRTSVEVDSYSVLAGRNPDAVRRSFSIGGRCASLDHSHSSSRDTQAERKESAPAAPQQGCYSAEMPRKRVAKAPATETVVEENTKGSPIEEAPGPSTRKSASNNHHLKFFTSFESVSQRVNQMRFKFSKKTSRSTSET